MKYKAKFNILLIGCIFIMHGYMRADEQDTQRGVALYERADQLEDQGNHKAALELYAQALQIFKKNFFGSQNNYVASTLNNMGGAYKGLGDINNALQCYESALSIRENVLGNEHQYTGSTIGNIATILQEKGDYEDSLKMFKRAIAIYKKTLRPDTPNTLVLMNNLGVLYYKMGNYENAIETDKECLRIEERALGKENPATLNTLINLGTVYQDCESYQESMKCYQDALLSLQKKRGYENSDALILRNNIGLLYNKLGDYPKAIETLEDLVKTQQRIAGPQSVKTARAMMALGEEYKNMGRYDKAIDECNRALIILNKTLGEDHPESLLNLNNIADAYRGLGNYEKAIPIYNMVLAGRIKKLGPDNPDVAISYDDLACTFDKAYHTSEAIECELKAVGIMKKSYGADSPKTANMISQLSFLYGENGNIDEAIKCSEDAILKLQEVNNDKTPQCIQCLLNLADLYYQKGDLKKSYEYLSRSVNARQSMLAMALNTDASTRLAWEEEKLKLHLEPSVLKPVEVDQLILRWKGVVLDSLLEDASSARSLSTNSSANRELAKIAQIRTQLSSISFSSNPKDITQSEKLQSDLEKNERNLSLLNSKRGGTRKSSSITVDQVVSNLSENSTLIDFIEFIDFNKKVCSYGISILSNKSSPQFIRIDDADIIDDAVTKLKTAITSGNQDELKKYNNVLFEKLWFPIKAKLPDGNKKLFIGPDGLLNFLSFSSIFDPQGKFLSEDQDIAYVATGRDLTRFSSRNFDKTAVVFANPLFDISLGSSPSTNDGKSASELSELSRLVLSPLPGTETEWLTLKSEIEAAGWSSTAFLGADATKEKIFSLSKPGILHLATHGFYLNLLSGGEEHSRGMKVVAPTSSVTKKAFNNPKENTIDPMRASGIALAGAQSTLRAWGEKKCPPPENDGVLTAENVSGLNLNGTWLVTLSACETGVGESKSGEGVYGLRRAFMMAGAQNLLMSLWAVSDEITPKIMADFYKKALATGDASGALADVQRDWLVKLRNEKGLLVAVRDAGPFAMVVMANPNAKPMPEATPQATPSDESLLHSSSEQRISDSSSAMTDAMTTPSSGVSTDFGVLEFNEALSRADAGDATAQAIVSIYYSLGYKIEKDLAKAVEYATKSAGKNNPLGQYQLGVLTSGGDGVDKDPEKGRVLKLQSIDGLNTMANDPYALAALGAMALRGEGVAKNMKKAAVLYQKAADLGYAPAQILYATMLSKGVGVSKDNNESLRYMQKASEQNFSPQQ